MAIKGLNRLNRKLKRFPEAAIGEIRAAMEQSAAEIVAMAKSFVRVDTGALRDSIGWTWGKAPDGAMVLGEVRAGRGAGNLRITIFAGNELTMVANKRGQQFQNARIQEFGTKERPGQPYFYPAYRAIRKRVKSRVSRAVTKSAKRVAAGG
jgi:HK97 gp10 family phage protein